MFVEMRAAKEHIGYARPFIPSTSSILWLHMAISIVTLRASHSSAQVGTLCRHDIAPLPACVRLVFGVFAWCSLNARLVLAGVRWCSEILRRNCILGASNESRILLGALVCDREPLALRRLRRLPSPAGAGCSRSAWACYDPDLHNFFVCP